MCCMQLIIRRDNACNTYTKLKTELKMEKWTISKVFQQSIVTDSIHLSGLSICITNKIGLTQISFSCLFSYDQMKTHQKDDFFSTNLFITHWNNFTNMIIVWSTNIKCTIVCHIIPFYGSFYRKLVTTTTNDQKKQHFCKIGYFFISIS